MGVVTWIRKKPRLSNLVDQPGGMSARSALKAVEELLEPMREEGRERVEASIAALEGTLAASDGLGRAVLLSTLYAQATTVLDAAGPFGLDDLCSAAFSLCELSDRYSRIETPVDVRAVEVHVQALRLFNTSGTLPDAARDAVLGGLARVLERLPA
jgi:hypothetical protein